MMYAQPNGGATPLSPATPVMYTISTAIPQQPTPLPPQAGQENCKTHERDHRQPVHRHWNTNVCDCCLSCKSCCTTIFFPCYAYAKIHRHVYKDQEGSSNCGSCSRACCCCVMPGSVFLTAPVRKQLRVKYNLPAKPCNDCCTMLWCPCCALAQELREIEYQQQANPPEVQQMKA